MLRTGKAFAIGNIAWQKDCRGTANANDVLKLLPRQKDCDDFIAGI